MLNNSILIIGLISILVVMGIVLLLFIRKLKKKNTDHKDQTYYQSSITVKENLGVKLKKLLGGKILDESSFQQLEETLMSADIGPAVSYELINKIKGKSINEIDAAIGFLKSELKELFIENYFQLEKGKLNIILILGVNGVGKTTSIAKLAHYYLNQNLKVLLAAGDTFRAAASEQLSNWAKRLDIPIIKQGEKADAASVVYDAIDSARAKGVDLLIVDTAGRLHNKKNLMEELKKIERVIRTKGGYPRKNLLVIDATTGQNAYTQAESFHKAVGIDGIILTKYDSQSKGGIVFTIEKKLSIPFYFLGTGEKLDNWKVFEKNEFIDQIFDY